MQLHQATIDYYARLYCDPLTLVLNFALCQYLCGLYYPRRRELRVRLLLWFGVCGFASLIPFANPDTRLFNHLNDVSEVCSNMTFLMQIVLLGKDVTRRVRIRSLMWLTRAAECLIVAGLMLTLKGLVELFTTTQDDLARLDGVDNVLEDVSLAFIFVFRFYYQALSKGTAWLLRNRKLELLLYVLFVTHEYPFLALNAATGASWESIQALWHRVTMTMCLLLTLREKLESVRSKRSQRTQHQSTYHRHHHKTYASKADSVNGPGDAGVDSPTYQDLPHARAPQPRKRSCRPVNDTAASYTATTGGMSRMPSLRQVTPVRYQ